MNMNVIGGVIRAVVPPILAFLMAKGTIPMGDYSGVITAVIAMITAGWSIKTNIPK
jgi:hypothetical protein